jgi:hypothetical protein
MTEPQTKLEKHPKPMVGELIRIHRNLHRYGLRGMAKQIGISHSTLGRVEEGKSVDGQTIIKRFHWLFGSAA